MALEQQLCLMLNGILVPDNTARRRAEAEFVELVASHPDDALLGLVKILSSHADVTIRQQAAIVMRNVLRDLSLNRETSVWFRLSASNQESCKSRLLEAVACETERTVRNAICDTVADLASGLFASQVEWPDLKARLVLFVQSGQSEQQAAGLKIFAELVPQLSKVIADDIAGVQNMVSQCAQAESAEVRSEALNFMVAVVLSQPRSIWKLLQPTLPLFVQGLQALLVEKGPNGISVAEEESAYEVLQSFVDLADRWAVFFKPHARMLAETLFEIAQAEALSERLRQLAVEVLICMAEARGKVWLKVPGFVRTLVEVLMKFMLDVENATDWLDSDDEESMSNLYEVGEDGIDRLARAMQAEQIMPTIFQLVSQYLRRTEWQFRFVGIIAISQTIEYLPAAELTTHLEQIVDMLLGKLKDPSHRVRYAACQAVGQAALDHAPMFGNHHAPRLLPALLELIESEPHEKVKAHALGAFVNLAENVTQSDLQAYVPRFMESTFPHLKAAAESGGAGGSVLCQQALSAIAVVAGVIEEDFTVYYDAVVPVLKLMVRGSTRLAKGKAIECLSIIGLCVGKQKFAADAPELMEFLLQDVGKVAYDDPCRDYILEGLCRMCRTLEEDFVPYLPRICPPLLETISRLSVSDSSAEAAGSVEAKDDDEEEDVILLELANSRFRKLKWSQLEEVSICLDIIATFVSLLDNKYGPFILPTMDAILPFLEVTPLLQQNLDDFTEGALRALALLLEAAQTCEQIPREEIRSRLMKFIEDCMRILEDPVTVIESASVVTGGLSKCLRGAGADCLSAEHVEILVRKLFDLIKASSARRETIASKRKAPGYEEAAAADGDDDDYEDDDDSAYDDAAEAILRGGYGAVIASIMKHHSDQFLSQCAGMTQAFIEGYIHDSHAENRAAAIYVGDDILEELGAKGAPLWPCFLETLIEYVCDADAAVRQAAAYGVAQAAKIKEMPAEAIVRAATQLVRLLSDPTSKDSANSKVTDNAVAAVASVVVHRSGDVVQLGQQLVQLWIDYLPLKSDVTEAVTVHRATFKLVLEGNAAILGQDHCNIPKLVQVAAVIYSTIYADAATNDAVRSFVQRTGFAAIKTIAANFDECSKKGLEKIHRDTIAATTVAAG